MSKAIIEKDIKAFFFEEQLKEEFEKLKNNDSLLELGLIDSVKMLDLIEFIQEKFDVEVDDEDLVPENFDSIDAIVTYISDRS